MIIHSAPSFIACFGDRQDEISLDDIDHHILTDSLQSFAHKIKSSKLIFPHQVHADHGFMVNDEYLINHEDRYLFYQDGDYVITDKNKIGIGVVTADCLPIILYAPQKHVAAIVHAGWRGALKNVVASALDDMQKNYGVMLSGIKVFFGPAAKSCCYEVQQDFYDAFMEEGYDASAFVRKKNKIYFDNAVFVSFQLRNLGIRQDNIYTKYNICTICDISFCSYRRDQDKAGRQVTVVALR